MDKPVVVLLLLGGLQIFSGNVFSQKAGWPTSKQAQQFSDFGRVHSTVAKVAEVHPVGADDVRNIILAAAAIKKPVRIRASGHSMNGSTLPINNELLLITDSLNFFSFDNPGTITVGAGVRVHDVLTELFKIGYTLPGIPGGGVNITVGGFISAGGFDRTLEKWRAPYGGFWANIRSVTLVNGRGKIMTVTPTDTLYRFLFGSMGQLGVIVSAVLDILPDPTRPEALKEYPKGRSGRIEKGSFELFYPNDNDVRFGKKFESMFWYSLFGHDTANARVRAGLEFLKSYHVAHTRSKVQYSIICIPVAFRKFNPPLLYKTNEPFTGCALQVFHIRRDSSESKLIADMYPIADSLGKANNFYRYIQAEYVPKSPLAYKAYFKPSVYKQFLYWKKRQDPLNIINPGTVFENY